MKAEEYGMLETLLKAAALGVSADNGQPWFFRWRGSHLYVHLESQRATSYFDREQFAALLGLGSVLENLTVAAVHLGYTAEVSWLARDRKQVAPPLAQVRFGFGQSESHSHYPEIFRRTTNRKRYRLTPVSIDIQNNLAHHFSGLSSLRLVLVHEREQINYLASLIAAAERIRFDFSNAEIHEDFFGRLRFTEQEAATAKDGLWIRCLEAKAADRLALQLLGIWRVARTVNRMGISRLFAKQSLDLFRHTPLIALVIGRNNDRGDKSSCGNRPNDDLFLEGGRLCQRLWLAATGHGLACQPMAVLPLFFAQHAIYGNGGFPPRRGVTVAELETLFNNAFGVITGEHLLMTFRLGYASPPSARSFRRSVGELLTVEDDSSLVFA